MAVVPVNYISLASSLSLLFPSSPHRYFLLFIIIAINNVVNKYFMMLLVIRFVSPFNLLSPYYFSVFYPSFNHLSSIL